jgi:hypothetical protein
MRRRVVLVLEVDQREPEPKRAEQAPHGIGAGLAASLA